jgi:hypothetical protein
MGFMEKGFNASYTRDPALAAGPRVRRSRAAAGEIPAGEGRGIYRGAGSPQAQRVQIARQAQLEFKKRLARALAGIPVGDPDWSGEFLEDYMAREFQQEQ